MPNRSQELLFERRSHASFEESYGLIVRDRNLAEHMKLRFEDGMDGRQFRPKDGFELRLRAIASVMGEWYLADSVISRVLKTEPFFGHDGVASAETTDVMLKGEGLEGMRQLRISADRSLRALTAARPFYMPVSFGHTVMNSMPLSREAIHDIKLPFPSVFVYFSKPLLITKDMAQIDGGLLPDRDHWLFGVSIDQLRPDGRLVYELMHTIGDDPEKRQLYRTGKTAGESLTPSQRPILTVLENLAAYVSWGKWINPELEPSVTPETSTEISSRIKNRPRKQSLTSVLRTMQDAIAPVHVVDIREASEQRRTPSGVATGRRPHEHDRRGHWRHTPTGPLGDSAAPRDAVWRYIAPTVVNSGVGVRPEVTVWRMPYPPEVRAAVQQLQQASKASEIVPGLDL